MGKISDADSSASSGRTRTMPKSGVWKLASFEIKAWIFVIVGRGFASDDGLMVVKP